ncbi:MAG: hypothetical protein HYT49_00285 [Candidatus Wildermuthbacteria bacterium]|nr:hypothetical protein [Candidatus Wildermuthbacteria bacterium]
MTVCKDMGGANVVAPIAQVLSNQGHEVFPVLEGMGAYLWSQLCSVPPIFRGTDDYRIVPFSLDVGAVLGYYRPDVVVVGVGSPSHLEGEFARAAQIHHIPLVLMEDFWGGFRRITGLRRPPDLALTLDEYSSSLVRQDFGRKTKICITGNPGVRVGVEPDPEVYWMRYGGELVIAFCGGGSETAEQIDLLSQCLAVTSKPWKLIPRWHPKEADRPDKKNGNQPYRETWNALLAPLGDRVVRVDGPPTDNIVVASDLVLAGFSTLLTTAAKAGVPVAALVTPAVQKSLQEESGLLEVPQVVLGVADLVVTPVNLALLNPCSSEARDQLMPFDPAVGASAICDLVEGR